MTINKKDINMEAIVSQIPDDAEITSVKSKYGNKIIDITKEVLAYRNRHKEIILAKGKVEMKQTSKKSGLYYFTIGDFNQWGIQSKFNDVALENKLYGKTITIKAVIEDE